MRIETNIRENVQVVNNPVYSRTGHIVYQRDQGNLGLWALPFDAERGVATGDPFLIASEMGHASVSLDGTLVQTMQAESSRTQLIAVSRSGEVLEELTDANLWATQPALSAGGRRLAYLTWETGEVSVQVVDYPDTDSRHLVARTETAFRWSADGSEFILMRHPDGLRMVNMFTVVENWYEEFRED